MCRTLYMHGAAGTCSWCAKPGPVIVAAMCAADAGVDARCGGGATGSSDRLVSNRSASALAVLRPMVSISECACDIRHEVPTVRMTSGLRSCREREATRRAAVTASAA